MVYSNSVMQTKLTFFKSYYRMGWWAARVPMAAEWGDQRVDQFGFGTTQTQAERDLVRQEQARQFEAAASEIAA